LRAKFPPPDEPALTPGDFMNTIVFAPESKAIGVRIGMAFWLHLSQPVSLYHPKLTDATKIAVSNQLSAVSKAKMGFNLAES